LRARGFIRNRAVTLEGKLSCSRSYGNGGVMEGRVVTSVDAERGGKLGLQCAAWQR
jgi:predicted transcriptional regulator